MRSILACEGVHFPSDVPSILRGLRNVLVSKLVMVDGGSKPGGRACGAFHWQGFIGMDCEVVDLIGAWSEAAAP